ncbi:MAG: hypothetical protein HY840_11855 [Bacteroidetes bacterium]|nr:hypothetical protein [Bacteroidota bacterium]
MIPAKEYLSLKGRKVLIRFSYDLKDDVLHAFLPVLKIKDEDFSKYLPSTQALLPYRGKYVLHGNKIEATFFYPYYMNIPSEERIW